ncbi:MAG: hypothetical protein ACTHV2_12735 [Brachybacterium sp.]|uniref:hypothetical protein n=1 Tax=Brachybacterium sp. TaxID=1891286 RepID=UPI00264DD88E|nr:hypothetical protein [Brachybacterium sp.]MDN6301577.1 hypothetical protein [Brachybacterium sp.]MDN6327980.1 hypothetical protein [Brachybacterium sp.]
MNAAGSGGRREEILDGAAEMFAERGHPGSLPIRLLATLDAESVSEDHHGRHRMARLRKVHEHLLASCFSDVKKRGLLRDAADGERGESTAP